MFPRSIVDAANRLVLNKYPTIQGLLTDLKTLAFDHECYRHMTAGHAIISKRDTPFDGSYPVDSPNVKFTEKPQGGDGPVDPT